MDGWVTSHSFEATVLLAITPPAWKPEHLLVPISTPPGTLQWPQGPAPNLAPAMSYVTLLVVASCNQTPL